MATSYTSILKLALPATGELAGTWGDVVNQNITSMIEEAIAGLATINTWSGASHTLTTANGTTSESRAAILELSGSPGAAATVICPDETKIYVVRNGVSGGFAATIKTAAGTGVTIPNGKVAAVYCDGTNVRAATEFFSSVDIDGGTIDGTTIGATSASTGAFTTLASSSTTVLNGTTIPASKTLVDTDSAQTLTNKTLTSPTITGTGTAAFGNLSYTGTLTGGTGVINIGSGQVYKDASGNLGVTAGTTPEARLTINPGPAPATSIGGRSISYGANLLSTSGRTGFLVRVANNFTGDGDDAGFQWLYPFDTGGNANHKVFRSATGATLIDKFWINQSGGGYFAGNVGIATSSPTCLLDVNGGIRTSRTAVTSPAATDGNVFSGTYTPTLTNTTNVSSSTANVCQYMRVGNVLTVSGSVFITPVSAAFVEFRVSLPVASSFTASSQLAGTGLSSVDEIVRIVTTSGFTVARALYTATSTTQREIHFSFTYRVV
jgi:hypothetical protein